MPVPTQLTAPVTVSTTIVMDESPSAPTDVPVGSTSTNIPFKTSVPGNITVPVAFSESVTISTTFQLDANVPVTILMANTPFAAMLRDLRLQLLGLNQKF